jgi:hypothetical protein
MIAIATILVNNQGQGELRKILDQQEFKTVRKILDFFFLEYFGR